MPDLIKLNSSKSDSPNKKRGVKNSLQKRVALSVSLVILFFGTLASATTYLLSHNTLLSLLRRDIVDRVMIQAQQTNQVFVQSQNMAATVAKQQNIVNFLSGSLTGEDLERFLEHQSLSNFNVADMYSAIYVMDANGITLLSTDERFVGQDYSFRDYFKSAIKETPFVDVSVGVTSGELGYYFSHPVYDGEKIIGVVVMKLKPEFVNNTIFNDIKGNEVLLVDEYGVVMHATESDAVFKSLGELTQVIRSEISNKKRYAGIDIEPLGWQEVQDYLLVYQEPGSFTVNLGANDTSLVSVASVGDLPFYVLYKTDVSQSTESAISNALVIAGFVAVAAFVATVIILFFVRRFLKPLGDLVGYTEKLGEEELDSQLDVKTGDEFENLADALNKMASKLSQSRKNIEKKVAERTKQLEKMNRAMVGRELKMIDLKKKLKKYEDKK